MRNCILIPLKSVLIPFVLNKSFFYNIISVKKELFHIHIKEEFSCKIVL